MDSENSYLVAGDSPALLAILMSSFFPLWVKAVNKGKRESKKLIRLWITTIFRFLNFQRNKESYWKRRVEEFIVLGVL